jgi:hypothetical protein
MFGNISILLHPEPNWIHSTNPVPLGPISVSSLYVQVFQHAIYFRFSHLNPVWNSLIRNESHTSPLIFDLITLIIFSEKNISRSSSLRSFLQSRNTSCLLCPRMWFTTLLSKAHILHSSLYVTNVHNHTKQRTKLQFFSFNVYFSVFKVGDDVYPVSMADKGVNVYPLTFHWEKNRCWNSAKECVWREKS